MDLLQKEANEKNGLMVTPVIHADVTQHAVEGYGGDDTAIPTSSTTVGQNIASIHSVYRQRSI